MESLKIELLPSIYDNKVIAWTAASIKPMKAVMGNTPLEAVTNLFKILELK